MSGLPPLPGGIIQNNPVGGSSLSTVPTIFPPIGGLTAQGIGGGASLSTFPNFSGIPHNVAKLFAGANFLFYDWALGQFQEDAGAFGKGQSTTRYLCGPWSQWRQFRSYLLGYTSNSPDPSQPGFGILLRQIPAQHPIETYQYVTDVQMMQGLGAMVLDPSVQALDKNGQPQNVPILDQNGQPLMNWLTNKADGRLGFPYYAHNPNNKGPDTFDADGNLIPGQSLFYDGCAILKVMYGHYPYIIKDDAQISVDPNGEAGRWVTWEYQPAMQAIQVPANAAALLKFTDVAPAGIANTPISQNPVLLLPTASLRATWWDVPDLPFEAIEDCVGHVNPTAFPSAAGPLYGNPKPSGTLLMNPPKFENYRTPWGYWSRKVTYDFMYRQSGWNSFPANDGNFYPATFGGASGAPTLYKAPTTSTLFPGGARFQDLFRVPAPVAYQ